MKLKQLLTITAALLLAAGTAAAADLVNVAGASGIAVDGYDTVAFFTDGKPMHGDPSDKSTYQGATYFFASRGHKTLFDANPAKYVPQFGGFCAYGVGLNALFPVDISTWQVRDGKLYLNLNPEILKAFNADLSGNLKKADGNWTGLVQKNAK